MFSCEYCEILQSSFFFRTPLSASVDSFSTIGQFSNNMKYVGREGASPLPLLENRTKALTLEKRPHCVHLWVELFIRNVVFNLSRKKKSKISPCRPFFCDFDEMFIEVPQFHETFPAFKIFCLHTRYFSTKSVYCLQLAFLLNVKHFI